MTDLTKLCTSCCVCGPWTAALDVRQRNAQVRARRGASTATHAPRRAGRRVVRRNRAAGARLRAAPLPQRRAQQRLLPRRHRESSRSSPEVFLQAIHVPFGTLSPILTLQLVHTTACGDGISMEALSDSTVISDAPNGWHRPALPAARSRDLVEVADVGQITRPRAGSGRRCRGRRRRGRCRCRRAAGAAAACALGLLACLSN